jgi:glutamate/tyrosine decarboxylase-like PLP-dependent enzyme
LQHDVDVEADGLAGLPSIPVLSSGYVHASALKAIGMLGIGRRNVQVLASDAVGRLDLKKLDDFLGALDGRPAVIIANAGDVNTGDFDPLAEIIAIARRHRAWVHVDGAFGLFAALSPLTRHLVEGIEQADSVTVDGHKWLNVPYDTGFAFVRDPALHAGAFSASAAYLGRLGGVGAALVDRLLLRAGDCGSAGAGKPRPGDAAAGASPGRVGDAARLRTRRPSRDGRTPSASGPSRRGSGRRGT